MGDRSIIHGVLFYTTVYVNCILLSVAILTGRWIFLLLILLTIGLTAYMMYMTSHNDEHLKSVGVWVENLFSQGMQRVK